MNDLQLFASIKSEDEGVFVANLISEGKSNKEIGEALEKRRQGAKEYEERMKLKAILEQLLEVQNLRSLLTIHLIHNKQGESSATKTLRDDILFVLKNEKEALELLLK